MVGNCPVGQQIPVLPGSFPVVLVELTVGGLVRTVLAISTNVIESSQPEHVLTQVVHGPKGMFELEFGPTVN
jgi:hypothetical protein